MEGTLTFAIHQDSHGLLPTPSPYACPWEFQSHLSSICTLAIQPVISLYIGPLRLQNMYTSSFSSFRLGYIHMYYKDGFMGLWKKGRFGIVRKIVRKVQVQINLSEQGKGVKQGHFVVIATQGWKAERFVIELGYLYHPDFAKLLKQAEEEFGFSQAGALAIPCEPDHLKRIINATK